MAYDEAGLFDTSVTMKGSGKIFLLSRLFIFLNEAQTILNS